MKIVAVIFVVFFTVIFSNVVDKRLKLRRKIFPLSSQSPIFATATSLTENKNYAYNFLFPVKASLNVVDYWL